MTISADKRAELEGRVKFIVENLVEAFDMGWIEVYCRFDDTNDPDRTLCKTTGEWKYRRAALEWSLPQVALNSDEEICGTAIHELVHVLIEPLFGSLKESEQERLADLNEFSTESVSRVLCKLFSENLAFKKDAAKKR